MFVLNSVALLVFPAIGSALHLTQTQFGLWAALAIHDTSSVVGAGARFGAVALVVATTVKLARALWIVPVSFGTAFAYKSNARVHWPWFSSSSAWPRSPTRIFPFFSPCIQHSSTWELSASR